MGWGADIELSKDSKVAVRRLLNCDKDDYYQLLGVAATSDPSKLKKAYRLQVRGQPSLLGLCSAAFSSPPPQFCRTFTCECRT